MTLHFATYLSGKFLLGTGAARPCIDTPDETIEGFRNTPSTSMI